MVSFMGPLGRLDYSRQLFNQTLTEVHYYGFFRLKSLLVDSK